MLLLGLVGGHALARGARSPVGVPSAHEHDIIHNASEAIISTDAAHTIVMANPSAAAMFATSVEEMQGSPLGRFLTSPPGSNDGPASYFSDSGRVGRRATDYAVSGIRADGGTFPLEGSVSTAQEGNASIHTIILRDVSGRHQVQEKLSRSHAQLRELSAALQTIREEERTHIARELHDDLGQLLATLRLDLTLLQQHADAYQPSAAILRNMDQLIVTAIASLRRIAGNLRPRALDEGGLYFALHSLRNDFIQRHAVDLELLADENELILDDAHSTAIYRIVQESLTNIARHAQARKVTVALQRIGAQLTIYIQDDGRGIADSDMAKAASFGLLGMRERVWGLHGDISISGNDGAGTRIDIVLPLPPAPP